MVDRNWLEEVWPGTLHQKRLRGLALSSLHCRSNFLLPLMVIGPRVNLGAHKFTCLQVVSSDRLPHLLLTCPTLEEARLSSPEGSFGVLHASSVPTQYAPSPISHSGSDVKVFRSSAEGADDDDYTCSSQ